MKLYSGPLSLFTAKVRVALDEKQLAVQRIDVGWSLANRYEPHHPDVVALNPRQQVPVLVDGDVVVYDSTQILEYLEDAYPQLPLRPADVAGRAYLCGDYSYADIATFIFVQAAAGLGSAPADAQVALRMWLDRMRERPAVRREVDAMNAFVASLLAPKVAAAR